MCVGQYSKLSKLAAFKIHKYAYSIQCLTMDVYATDLEQSSILWRMKSSILFPYINMVTYLGEEGKDRIIVFSFNSHPNSKESILVISDNDI
jgi:hypothetical protein